MHMELDCGIPRARITAWLEDELAFERNQGGAWVFSFEGHACQISIAPLENRVLGKLNLERTLVTIEGDERAIARFHRLFTLRFISAGG